MSNSFQKSIILICSANSLSIFVYLDLKRVEFLGEQQSVKKGLSAAAQKVLSSLPDLSFMRAASLSRTQV